MFDKNLFSSPINFEIPQLISIPENPMQGFIDDISNQINAIHSQIQLLIRPSIFEEISTLVQSVQAYATPQLEGLTAFYNELSNQITPFVEWVQRFDFSEIIDPLSKLDKQRLEELNAIYLMAMYNCKWFPYAGWIADDSLFDSVDEIIETSRSSSKRKEQRIDKAILAYYTDKRIKQIKSSWWKSDLNYCLRKTLSQAINAYFRKEYVLTISCLATMWEGLIYIKAHNALPEERKRQNMSLTKQELADLTAANNYDKIFSDYFENYIVSQCNNVSDVIEGVPNRHGTSHSWYKKYPNKKAALNAILLTDFIINLNPNLEA